MLLLARSPAAAPARSWIEDWDTPLLVKTGARVEALRRIQRLAGLHGRPPARKGVRHRAEQWLSNHTAGGRPSRRLRMQRLVLPNECVVDGGARRRALSLSR
jgi:hypothetical protein